jgi:hypothetical protein
MMDMLPVKLSKAQLRKLKMGGAIGLKPSNFMMGEGQTPQHSLAVLPQNLRKIASAMRRNKGMRLQLKPGENVIDVITGEGFLGDISSGFNKAVKTVGSAVKSVGSTVKKLEDKAKKTVNKTIGSIRKGANTVGRETVKFVKSKQLKRVGRQIAKPLIRQGIPIAAQALGATLGSAAATLSGNPEFAPIAARIGSAAGRQGGEALSRYVSRKTGYGMKGRVRLPSGVTLPTRPIVGPGGIRKITGEGFLPAGDKSGSGIQVVAPSAPAGEYIQTGSPYAALNSASMSPFIAPSIQLAGKQRVGGGFTPAG